MAKYYYSGDCAPRFATNAELEEWLEGEPPEAKQHRQDMKMRRLMGWSAAELAAYRASLHQPASRHWVDGLRRVLPAELLDGVVSRDETTAPVPVGESLSVTFDQLLPGEQRAWRALAANDSLSPQQRSEAMRANEKAERAWLLRICDTASANALSSAITFAELPAERQQYWYDLAMRELPTLEPGEELSLMCQAAVDARAPQPTQGRLFTDAELAESIPERLKLPAHQRRS